jgi:hypothetical protein
MVGSSPDSWYSGGEGLIICSTITSWLYVYKQSKWKSKFLYLVGFCTSRLMILTIFFMSVGNGFGSSKRGGAQQLPPPLPHFFSQLNQKIYITPMIQVFLWNTHTDKAI